MNQVVIIGHVGNEPELKMLDETKKVVNFSIATNDKWTDKSGNKQEKTEWHKIVCWGGLASNCYDYLKKGSLVAIEGKIQTRSYDNKEGEKVYITEIKASNVQFLSKKGE